MSKKSLDSKTLGPTSSALLQYFLEAGRSYFSLAEASEVLGKSKQATSKFLHQLKNRGLIDQVMSGSYIILLSGESHAQISNWPMIAKIMAGGMPYFLSHYSAMRIHGMTIHAVNDVYLTCSQKKKQRQFHHLTYHFIYSNPVYIWGDMSYWINKQEQVQVSDIERTLLDGLSRPELCGGMMEVIRGLWYKQTDIDQNKLAKYAARFHNKAAVKRLGFILETLALKFDKIDDIHRVISNSSDYSLLDPLNEATGKKISRWKLQINMNKNNIIEGL